MVPRLALLEKGFDENEYIIQLVDAGKCLTDALII